MCDNWMKSKDARRITGLLSYDYSAAFDTLDAELLCSKLTIYGFDRPSVNLILSFLSDRKQYVEANGFCSRVILIFIGSPQGSCLSPVLFIIYTGDLNLWLKESDMSSYADDVYEWKEGEDINEVIQGLESDAKEIINFAAANNLILNDEKTHFIVFRPNKSESSTLQTIKIGKNFIQESTSIKILGVTLNNDLAWDDHHDSVQKNLRSKLYLLKKLSYHIPRHCLTSILDGFFVSRIRYCLEIYGQPAHPNLSTKPDSMKRLQILLNAAMRIATGPRISDKIKITELQQ